MSDNHPMPGYYEAASTHAALIEVYERSVVDLTLRIAKVRDAHEWGCDCTPDDPCRISIALDGGPSRPERRHLRCTCHVHSDAIGPHARGCPNHPEAGR